MTRAARILCEQETPIADPALSQTKEQLNALYPPGPVNILPPPAHAVNTIADEKQVKIIVRKFIANGAAPGVSGWTGEMLAVIVDDEECLRGLTQIVSDALSGQLLREVQMRLVVKRGIPLRKNSNAVRPVTIDEALLKLIERYGMETFSPASAFPTIQLGVGKPGGVEKAIHLLRAATESYGNESILISTDIQNAYNTRDRRKIMEAVYARPEARAIWKLLHWEMTTPTVVHFYAADGSHAHQLLASQGVPQGSVIAPWAYAVSMQWFFEEATKKAACKTAAIVDDFSIAGTVDDALAVFDHFKTLCAQDGEGITLRPDKCRVLWPHDTPVPVSLRDEAARRNMIVVERNMEVLGSVIGCDNRALAIQLEKAVDGHNKFFGSLSSLPVLIANQVLRVCGQPKMNFLARVTPPHVSRPALRRFDNLVLGAAQRINNLPDEAVNDQKSVAFHLLTMPIRTGGLGLRLYETFLDAAYFASASTAISTFDPAFVRERCLRPQVASPSSIEHINYAFAQVTRRMPPRDDFPTTQQAMWAKFADESKIIKQLQKAIVASIELNRASTERAQEPWTDADRAAVMSSKDKNASLWLTSIPDGAEHCLSDYDTAVNICLRLRLSPVRRDCIPQGCTCTREERNSPDHVYVCGEGNRKRRFYQRHQAVVQWLRHTAAAAGVQVSLNVKDAQAGDETQPDAYLVGRRMRVVTDVAVAHPAAKTYAAGASKSAKHAAGLVEKAKKNKYDDREKHGFIVTPCVVETFGARASGTDALIHRLSDEAGAYRAQTPDDFMAWANRSLSCAIARGNAIMVTEYERACRVRLPL
jgi:hypothetical protein